MIPRPVTTRVVIREALAEEVEEAAAEEVPEEVGR